MLNNRLKIIILSAIIVCIGLFYVLTIRPGHIWGGDFAMYIHHAQNIVQGKAYAATGYIYNPAFPGLSPKTFPPLFPFILAPVYQWFGFNLAAMKIEIVIIFLLFLITLLSIFRTELPFAYLTALVMIIGFNPWFWEYKDRVQSDIPFLLFTYLALAFIHRRRHLFNEPLLKALLAGILIYLAYGTRSVGIVILVALLIYDLVKFRKLTRFSLIASGVFIILMVTQGWLLHNDCSYLDQFAQVTPGLVIRNFWLYPLSLNALWDNGYNPALKEVMSLIILILAVGGYLLRIRQRITIFEVFFLIYFASIIFWPRAYRIRFIMPLVPLYLFYALLTAKELSVRFSRRFCPVALAVLIAAAYCAKYTTVNFGPIQKVDKKES